MIIEKFPDSTGESGVPLQPLAQLKLLELHTNQFGSNLVSINSFCSNIVNYPTQLTPSLLEKVLRMSQFSGDTAVQDWQRIWEDHERDRHLYAAACKHFGGGMLPHLTAETDSGREMIVPKRSKESRLGAPAPVKLTSVPVSTPSMSRVGPRLFWFSSSEVSGHNRINLQAFVGSSPGSNSPPSGAKTPTEGTTSAGASQIAASPLLEGQDWLAVRCEETTTNCWLACLTVEEAMNQLNSVADRASPISEYFGIMFELAGKTFARTPRELQMWTEHHYGGKGGGWDRTYSEGDASDAELLGSAAEAESGAELLKANVYLTSPTTLYARQRARTFWFAALISVAALAAMVGLITAWRVFHRQQLLSELKSNFVSSVSHELRSPLASVRLMAETLERGKVSESPKQHEYFRFIVQECRRLSSLVENVLDFSRIEQGRKEYEFEPTDLFALVQQTVKLMQPYAAERQVILEFVPGNSQPSTLNSQPSLDGKAIQQALVNLIDNAIKHSPKGGTVKVGLENVEDRGSGETPNGGTSNLEPRTLNLEQKNPESDHQLPLTLWVEDHGEGIPPEEHEKIFERFYRRGSELRRETQGVELA